MNQRFASPSVCARLRWLSGTVLCLATLLHGCGGGAGGGPGGGQQNLGNFMLSVSPSSAPVLAGGSVIVSLSATPIGGFSSQVSVQISGLPAGITASPATMTLSPGTPVNVTVSVAAGLSASTNTITFTGTSSGVQQQTTLSLSVTAAFTGPFPTRTKYVRTDAVTEYYQWVNSHWVVYHLPTARFFVTDPFSNQVFVLDPVTKTKIATIAVPGAYGIDLTPDQSTLYIGTLIGDVYVADPVAMQVKKRYAASSIGPSGYQAMIALALANGELALLQLAGGIPSVDGSNSIAIWNPTTNALTEYGTSSNPLCGSTNGHIFTFTLTADRTAVIANAFNNVCQLNASTGQSVSTTPLGTGAIVPSPDGKYIAVAIFPNAIQLLDQKTLNSITQFSVNSDNLSDAAILFSPDSSTLYVSSSTVVNAYNIATKQLSGWIPNIVVTYTSGGSAVGPPYNPIYAAFDTTGLMVGALEEGFGFLDITHLQTAPPGLGFLNAYLNPATGPVTGGTETQWGAPFPAQVFFDTSQAAVAQGNGDLLTVVTPPGQPGPADVYLFTSNGGMQLVPEGFSYGPTILEVAPSYSTAEGGGVGVIYGYGFGPANGSSSVPTGLSVTVAGQPATITSFNPGAYGISSPPFLLQSVHFTIPPGTAGSVADVSVTSSSGATKAGGAMTYLPALKTFPLAGSSLVQGVYDPVRNVYYFTDANKIQVFSLAQESWLSPIPIPAPQGKTQRLWGLALSADASKLAIADSQAGVVYLLNPSTPTSVQTFPVNPSNFGVTGLLVSPAGVAVSNSGVIWLTVDVQGGTGFHNFYELDTSMGTLTDLGIDGPGLGSKDMNLRTVISADNTRVFFNDDGYIFSANTATRAVTSAGIDPGCCYGDYDLALAPDQTQFGASSYLYDLNLNATASLTLNDREVIDISYVYGNKFSADGSLLFQPATQGLDVYDGRLGTFRARVAFPLPLSENYDALVSDGKDNVLITITGTNGNGIAIVDLTSLPEPAPLPYSAKSFDLSGSLTAFPSSGITDERLTQVNAKRGNFQPRVPHVTNAASARK